MAEAQSGARALAIAFVTAFPEMFPGPLGGGIVGRACDRGLAVFETFDLRDFAAPAQRQIDDYPFGGGGGMVLLPGPASAAVTAARAGTGHVIYMTPQGRPLRHADCVRLSSKDRLVILCGRYEGVDERVREALVDEEFSVGDFVVCGGELPGMLLAEAVVRLRAGVVGNAATVRADSFAAGLLEHPHYTRPREFDGRPVPPVLLSGDHAAIAGWKRRHSLLRTLLRRPELLAGVSIEPEDARWLADRCPKEWAGALPGQPPDRRNCI